MKFFWFSWFMFITLTVFSQKVTPVKVMQPSPLAAYSEEWNKPVYAACNTASAAIYMSEKEREIVYILNLARMYPLLFANTVVARYPSLSGQNDLTNDAIYYQSLLKKLRSQSPLSLLYGNIKCYTSARCHASSSGKSGYTGHVRNTDDCIANRYYEGECCFYGNDDPLNIVLSLLIDVGVPSLGHRQILLGNYTQIGVSIQDHLKYGHNSVLDLHS